MKNAKKPKEVKTIEDPKDKLSSIWREVYRKQKGLLCAMAILAVISFILIVVSAIVLRPSSSVVIVGYGDIYGEIAGISGGYRRSNWLMLLAFPILALVYGVLHNLLVLRVYRKYGRDTAFMLAIVSIILVVATLVVLFRLTGEW